MTDLASLGVQLETSGVAKGASDLDKLVDAAQGAEAAVDALTQASGGASDAVADVGAAATEATKGVSAMEAMTKALAESEAEAQSRIRDMVRSSLDKQQAMLAAATATKKASDATRELSQASSRGGIDSMSGSFAQAQQELVALSEAMSQHAQTLDDIGERREWVTELYDKGLISFADYESHLKTVDRQEKALQRSIADHAREVDILIRTYDPASAALEKFAEDQVKLDEALKSGAISAEQHSKAIDGLTVGRAAWQAEAEGVKETAKQINALAFSSSAAFRDYSTFLSALGRGDMATASNQVLQLATRTNALRAAMNPTALSIGAVAAAAGVMVAAFHSGQKEIFELHRSIVLSGSAAGVTAGQLALMAESVAEIAGTRREASAALAQLASSGRVAASDLEQYAEVAIALRREAGQSFEETARIFSSLAREPVEATLKLNESLNYLTESEYRHIVALKEQGDLQAASALAQRLYADQARERTQEISQHLPTLTRAARATGDAFKTMWSAISGVGVDTPEQRLRDMQAERGDRPLLSGRARFDIRLEARDRQEMALQARVDEARRRATERAEQARAAQEAVAADAEMSRRTERARQIEAAVGEARASAIQRELQSSVAQYAAYEAQLEVERQSGLVSEEVYYAEKRKLIEQNRDAQIEALQSENALIAARSARAMAEVEAERDVEKRAQKEADAQILIIGNQAMIKDNEAAIAILRGQAISELNVLAMQQEAAGKAMETAYDNARASAQSYLDVLRQQQERELSSFGRGDRSRERDDSRNRIDDQYAQQKLRLESDKRTNPQMTQEQYDRELAIIEEFHDKALRSDEEYWRRRTELEGSFHVGMREALSNYMDNARNVAERVNNAFTSAFQSMEDAFISFVQTGKLDFKSLADSIIADLLRMQVQAAASQLFGSLLGALGGMRGISGSSVQEIPMWSLPQKLATGTTRVPRDDFPAILHKDEAVLPAKLNPWAGGKNPFGGGVTINSTLNVGSGANIAQFQAALDARDAQLKSEIFDNLYRNRWAAAV